MDAYAAAKAKLFSMCRSSVINADDAYGGVMKECAAGRVFEYSAKGAGDLRAENISHSDGNTEFTACLKNERYNVRVGIPGMSPFTMRWRQCRQHFSPEEILSRCAAA